MGLGVLDLLLETCYCVGGLDIDLDDAGSEYSIEDDDEQRTWKTLPFVVFTVSFGMMGKIGKPDARAARLESDLDPYMGMRATSSTCDSPPPWNKNWATTTSDDWQILCA